MAYENFNQRQSFSPVKVGDELDVKIEAVGEKGDGICKKNGFVLFVPGAKEGQEVKIRVTKVLRRVGFAEIVGAEGKKATSGEDPEEEIEAEENEDLEEADEDVDETPQNSDDEENKDEEEYEDSENFGEDGEEQK